MKQHRNCSKTSKISQKIKELRPMNNIIYRIKKKSIIDQMQTHNTRWKRNNGKQFQQRKLSIRFHITE